MAPEIKWTESQNEAIRAKSRSIIVSAAAGSGKTSVLVERYARLLREGNPPERILAITFTRKAAAQLRERAMRKLMVSRDEMLLELIPRVAQAPISTIHSFCASLVREFAPVLDTDPAFASLEQDTAEDLKNQSFSAVTRLYSRKPELVAQYQNLLRHFATGRGDDSLKVTVFSLFEFLRRLPDPEARTGEWLAMYDDVASSDDFSESRWGELYIHELGREVELKRRRADELIAGYERINAPERWHDQLAVEFERVGSALGAFPDIDEMSGILNNDDWDRMPNRAKDNDLANRWLGRWKKFRDSIRKGFTQEWLVSPERLSGDLVRLHEGGALRFLIRLVRDFGKEYARVKKLVRALDYADLITFAHRLLLISGKAESDVHSALTSRFSHILMDEYQDTEPIQDAIVDMLAELPDVNVFRVGDIKQSIYRFRHAEPDLFRRRYSESGSSADSEKQRIDLADNFRSTLPVVNFINAVFGRLMTGEFGGAEYGEGHALHYMYGSLHPEPDYSADFPAVSVRLVIESESDSPGDNEEEESAGEDIASSDWPGNNQDDQRESPLNKDEISLDRKSHEAILVAQEIERLINAEPPIKVLEETGAGLKAVKLGYRHIAILMSTPATWVEAYAGVFARLGIPLEGTGKDMPFDEPLARDVLSFLKVIDNPIQDIPLAAVLLSPMYGVGPDALLVLRHVVGGDKNLFDAVEAVISSDVGETREIIAALPGICESEIKAVAEDFNAIRQFHADLFGFRLFASSHSIEDLIERLLSDTKLLSLASLDERSERVLSRFEWIRARARACADMSLSRFIEQLQSEQKIDLPVGGVADSVQILSIHQAKGLEFPVVILAGLGQNFNLSDFRRNILFDRELGFGSKVIHEKNPFRYPTAAFKVVEHKALRYQLEEEMRKLYVGMTRARERLVIVGSTSEKDIFGKHSGRRNDNSLPVLDRDSAKTFLDWLMPVILESPDVHNSLKNAGMTIYGANARGLDASFATEIALKPDLAEWYIAALQERDEASLDLAPDNAEGSGTLIPATEMELKIPKAVLFKYPCKAAIGLVSKVSATALSRADDPEGLGLVLDQPSLSFALPELHDSSGMASADDPVLIWTSLDDSARDDARPALRRGLVNHTFMQHLPFGQDRKIDVARELEHQVTSGILSTDDAEFVLADSIARFFETDLGERLQGRGRAMTEWGFIARLGRDEMLISERILFALGDVEKQHILVLDDDDFVVLQGIVDLVYEDESGRIIVDWKTDNVSADQSQERARRYELQMWAYCYAVNGVFGNVDNAALVFLKPGSVVVPDL